MAAALPPDGASCPREGSRFYCQLRGLGHGFCTEDDNKDESNNLNVTEASCWSLILWSPMSSTLWSAWLGLQTISLQDLFTHPFPVAWPYICLALLSVPHSSFTSIRKGGWNVENNLALALRSPPASKWGEYERGSKNRRGEMNTQGFFLVQFSQLSCLWLQYFSSSAYLRWCLFS